MNETQTTAEIIINLETMRENRKNVMNIFNNIKGKFLKGYFTINDLVRDYKVPPDNAKMMLDTLARNGMLNAQLSLNPASTRYTLEKNKQNQIENIRLWLKKTEAEVNFFSTAINVIEEEIEAEASDMKALKDEK